MTDEQLNYMLDKIEAMQKAGVSKEDISAIVESYKQKLATEQPVLEEKSIATQTAEATFPRYVKGIEEGRDVIEPIDVENDQLGSFMPFVSNEQLAATLGDTFSLPGRVVSGLAGNIKRAIDGDLTADEQIKANLADIGEIHGTAKQNAVLKFVEDVIRDPMLLLSLATGGLVGALSKGPQALRALKSGENVAKAIPYVTRMAQGSAAGIADVAGQDYLNDYAMDEDKIQLSDYALGGTVGAVMPFAADKSKAWGEKLYKKMKGAEAVPVPAKQFSQFKPAEENFGIGRDDLGLNRQTANEFGENNLGEYAGDLTGKLLDENRKRVPSNIILSKKMDASINQQGQKKLESLTLSDMLDRGPSQAVVDLTEKGATKLAPFLNGMTRGYNKAAEPVVNFGVDFANLVNKPIYGGYNLGNKAVAASARGLAAPIGDMLKNSSYRFPIDATIFRDQFQDEE